MSSLRDLIPLLKDLEEKHEAQEEAYIKVNNRLRPHGFYLRFDDCLSRFCIYPLQQVLDGTYQFAEEEKQSSR